MKALKINPATRTTEYAEMTESEINKYVGGYIIELNDLNNGLAIHSDLMASGASCIIAGKEYAGNCVMTGITQYGKAINMPDDVFPVIDWT